MTASRYRSSRDASRVVEGEKKEERGKKPVSDGRGGDKGLK
jgi:hypothetical protein